MCITFQMPLVHWIEMGEIHFWKCEDRTCRGRAITEEKEVYSETEHYQGPYEAETQIQISKYS